MRSNVKSKSTTYIKGLFSILAIAMTGLVSTRDQDPPFFGLSGARRGRGAGMQRRLPILERQGREVHLLREHDGRIIRRVADHVLDMLRRQRFWEVRSDLGYPGSEQWFLLLLLLLMLFSVGRGRADTQRQGADKGAGEMHRSDKALSLAQCFNASMDDLRNLTEWFYGSLLMVISYDQGWRIQLRKKIKGQ